jgi:PAS domain S-box-containing protein
VSSSVIARAPTAARPSAEQIAAVLAAATEDLIVATDPRGLITVFNVGAERMLGYTSAETVGQLTPLVWHDATEVDRRAAELGITPGFEVFVHTASQGMPETREWTLVRKDGQTLAAQLTVTPVLDHESAISGYVGIAHNVTARKVAEEALRAAESRYRMLVEQVPAITYIAALDDLGTTVYVSPQVQRLLGVSADEWLARPETWLERMHDDDREQVLDELERCRTVGEPFVAEYRLLDRDGRPVWFHDEAVTVASPSGGPGFLQGVMLDISERKQAEEALRVAEANYRGIVENAVEGIYQSSPDGRVLSANQSLARLLGYTSAADLVSSISDAATQVYADPNDRAVLVRELLEHGKIEGFECRVRRKNGRIIWILQNARAVFDDAGNLLYLEGTVEDISARKQAEEEHARLEQERDHFFSSISHDLRTPLAAITASIGVVLANEPPHVPPALHRLLVNIEESADDMARLVEDLLDLTRLQSGRMELHREPSDLREAVLRAVREIEPLAEARGQNVRVELPASPIESFVDIERLGRVLLNLLANANKYGRDGGAILVKLEEHPREAMFSVIDDGPGIAARDRARIFERFFRSESATASGTRGSGLGLPIARALVELHGGRIWVVSKRGEGAAFHVVLPLESLPAQAGGST